MSAILNTREEVGIGGPKAVAAHMVATKYIIVGISLYYMNTVTICLLSHGIFLISFFRRSHILFGMCSYDWIHCLILLGSFNSSFIEL